MIYCTLYDKSKPVVIDKLYDEYFYIYKNEIFYTNEKNILIHRKFNDTEDDLYKELNDNVFYPYYNIFNGRGYLLYTNKNFIFLNHKSIINTKKPLMPILVEKNNFKNLMWFSENTVYYTNINSDENRVYNFLCSSTPVIYSYSDADCSFYSYNLDYNFYSNNT